MKNYFDEYSFFRKNRFSRHPGLKFEAPVKESGDNNFF